MQGFLTAVKQEVNRKHAADKWALDDVVMITEVRLVVPPLHLMHPPCPTSTAELQSPDPGWQAAAGLSHALATGWPVLSTCSLQEQ